MAQSSCHEYCRGNAVRCCLVAGVVGRLVVSHVFCLFQNFVRVSEPVTIPGGTARWTGVRKVAGPALQFLRVRCASSCCFARSGRVPSISVCRLFCVPFFLRSFERSSALTWYYVLFDSPNRIKLKSHGVHLYVATVFCPHQSATSCHQKTGYIY